MKQSIALGLLALCLLTQSFLSLPRSTVSLIFDDQAYVELPRGVRATQIINRVNIGNVNVNGLDQMPISGSGQFSEQSFLAMMDQLSLSPEQLIVVDLRQESHGLINGKAISWKDGEDNYGNVGKTLAQIESDEKRRLLLARKAGRMFVNQKGEGNSKLIVGEIKTEREFVEGLGGIYVRIPVTDHNKPDDATIDRYIEFVKGLPADKWVHFHCKAGRGRTTTFMALMDIMKNSDKASLEDILERQERLGGTALKKVSTKSEERVRTTGERVEFLKQFYAYSQDVPDFSISWSEWLAQKSS